MHEAPSALCRGWSRGCVLGTEHLSAKAGGGRVPARGRSHRRKLTSQVARSQSFRFGKWMKECY